MLKDKTPIIVIVTPQGTGGITTMAEAIRDSWPHESPTLLLFRVPRHSLKGWLLYPVSLVRFVSLLVRKNVKLCHVNLASGGSPVRKLPFVFISRHFKIPLVLQIHSGKFERVLESPLTPRLWKRIVKFQFKSASVVLGLNRNQLAKLAEYKLLDGKPTYFIPNAIKVSQNDNVPEVVQDKEFDLIFVGRFSEDKGARDLIFALNAITNMSISLGVVGSMDLDDTPESIRLLLENHKVTFFGQLPNSEVEGVLRRSKVLILPSHFENFPMVILEAFRCSVPVIATDVGEVQMLIMENKTGRIVPPQDVDALEDAIRFMLSRKTDLSKMGNAAFLHLNENFEMSVHCSKLMDAYLEAQPNLRT